MDLPEIESANPEIVQVAAFVKVEIVKVEQPFFVTHWMNLLARLKHALWSLQNRFLGDHN